ncbi:MAG: tRNA (guanosine(37)-N1)-methyltransferase TrmD [Anaerolineales bacterium]|uniref:tRNA (guanosine(37)-N1)-methyltransferase TrmD n=1 Tax=Candidatus Villigracilis proximus TaxID=3140683 RepID=UPI003136D1B2|nr:tRNA (guanosine(37)-N1)-methyltransferase TrmD [Anaerolineales bacterium]MBK9207047.1 tRNA (guanosine(37)-N1)-methyltransferase TrmD [Anaerolineales bacterium]
MQFEVFTLLPEVFPSYIDTSIIKRARERGLITVRVHNIRDYTHDKHHMTDDTPYGGGGGMVMKPEPIFEAIESVLGVDASFDDSLEEREASAQDVNIPIILLTPQGRVFNQSIAQELSQHDRIVLICGRYEGFDERIREHLVTDEISIGDYVLTGGELPALIMIDSISRLQPDVLGDPTGAQDDSHAMGLLEYPHYTRPPEFRGWKIPEVLLSGAHAKIDKWRREQALLRTYKKRPDMLEKADLSKEDKKFLEKLKNEEEREVRETSDEE